MPKFGEQKCLRLRFQFSISNVPFNIGQHDSSRGSKKGSKSHVTPGISPTQSNRNLLIRRRKATPERFPKPWVGSSNLPRPTIIFNEVRHIDHLPLLPLLRGCCVFLLTWFCIQGVNPGDVAAWDQVPVSVHRHLNRAVSHLVFDVSQACPLLNEERRECVAQRVERDSPQACGLQAWHEIAMVNIAPAEMPAGSRRKNQLRDKEINGWPSVSNLPF